MTLNMPPAAPAISTTAELISMMVKLASAILSSPFFTVRCYFMLHFIKILGLVAPPPPLSLFFFLFFTIKK